MRRQGTSLTGLIFSQTYQILDRRIKGEMTGGSCEEGGGERNPVLREREKD